MARKKSYGKKPAETMRQRQLRLLKEQRARKAAASKFVKTKPESSTPRGAQGPRTAPQQGPSQRTVGLQGTRSRAAVRRSAPKPEFSTKSAPKQKALPPGKKGGALATTNKPRRRNVNTNPSKGTQMGTKGGGVKGQPRLPQGRSGVSARRAQAAGKAERVRQGTTSKDVRTGQPAGAANRMYGAKRVNAAVKRAQASGKRGGPLSTLVQIVAEELLEPVARGVGYQGAKAIRKALGGGEPTLDSKGNPIKKKAKPSPSKQGMSNIPRKEGTGKGSPNDKPQRSSRPSPQPTSKPSPQPTPRPTRSKTGANDPRNAAYIAAREKLNANSTKAERDKVRDMGIKLFKGMQGNKKKEKPRQSAANRAGYPGNRNY